MSKNPAHPENPKHPRPVASFGSEILAALMKGATGRVTLKMTYSQAIRFRQRIHSLREAMRRASHKQYDLCSKVRVSIEVPPDVPVHRSGRHFVPDNRQTEVRVILSPNDSEFADILAEAGIRPLGAVEAETKPLPSTRGDAGGDALSKLLGDLDD